MLSPGKNTQHILNAELRTPAANAILEMVDLGSDYLCVFIA